MMMMMMMFFWGGLGGSRENDRWFMYMCCIVQVFVAFSLEYFLDSMIFVKNK